MTNDEAIKTLREDYCGNRIICELYPDQCNREDCEIWLAIKALENAKNDNSTPESAQNVPNQAFKMQKSDVLGATQGCITRQSAIERIEWWFGILQQNPDILIDAIRTAPDAQPDLCDGCDRYGASCVGEGCGKLEMPEVAKDTNVPNNDCISRKAAIRILDAAWVDGTEYQGYLHERFEKLPSAQPDGEYISRQAVTESDLIDWYINSVDESEPVWTEEHIHELFNDFYLIPKED